MKLCFHMIWHHTNGLIESFMFNLMGLYLIGAALYLYVEPSYPLWHILMLVSLFICLLTLKNFHGNLNIWLDTKYFIDPESRCLTATPEIGDRIRGKWIFFSVIGVTFYFLFSMALTIGTIVLIISFVFGFRPTSVLLVFSGFWAFFFITYPIFEKWIRSKADPE